MNQSNTRHLRRVVNYIPLCVLFILGMWLVILRPMGSRLTLVPGDLGDARFNNYILEHFYQWATGATRDYWNAPFFYPFPGTVAFSDNLLGSAPFYAFLRWVGIDMISAFQGWYIFGSILNFAAAAYVLWRINLKPLAVGMGAFFFAFGLPLLAQENHAQLLYHFCIPLASFALWRLYQAPRLRYLIATFALVVWQLYLTIYMGLFLFLLLLVMIVLLPFFVEAKSFRERLMIWPRRLAEAWSHAPLPGRLLGVLSTIILGMALAILILPYNRTAHLYDFSRSWPDVFGQLPRWRNYFLADNSLLWGTFSKLMPNFPLRHEHQLFPGLAVVLLLVAGVLFHFRTQNRRMAWLHLSMAVALIALTLVVRGHSLYLLVWLLPGMNSIRAVSRIILVIMWPLSLFIAWAVDGVSQLETRGRRWMLAAVYIIAALMVAESTFYSHATYAKSEAEARLSLLRQEIPTTIPADPILFVANDPLESYWASELNGMLLAQQSGWPTLNGYSGNYPPGYGLADSCSQLPNRILAYMYFAGISSISYYQQMMQRVIPIGFQDCDPAWWEEMP